VTRATGSTFGTLFRVTTWGESHGKSVGCVIDGCPSNMAITTEEIQAELDRRRPGQSRITTPRSETGAAACKATTTLQAMMCRAASLQPSAYREHTAREALLSTAAPCAVQTRAQ
jgi:chorismate synthase